MNDRKRQSAAGKHQAFHLFGNLARLAGLKSRFLYGEVTRLPECGRFRVQPRLLKVTKIFPRYRTGVRHTFVPADNGGQYSPRWFCNGGVIYWWKKEPRCVDLDGWNDAPPHDAQARH